MNTDRENRKEDKMKKIYLKKWVEVAIIFIQAILFMTLAGECDDLKIFIVSKIIALVIFFVNHLILVKYTKLYDEVK